MKRLIAAVGLLWSLGMPGASGADTGSDCLSCHRERDAALVASWEKSRHHAPERDCRTCHGAEHDGKMAPRARRNEACTGCHAREHGSYAVSKHGVIATLEAGRMDFSQPLRDGNYRSPTCAYCHLHGGNHDAGAGLLPLSPSRPSPASPDETARSEARATPCQDCHSPRFVATWFTTGDRMVEIGRMKVREAAAVVTEIEGRDAGVAQGGREIFRRMTETHLGNVRLGVGHQSPDDQWWHGHPALDGDLLRLKSLHPLALFGEGERRGGRGGDADRGGTGGTRRWREEEQSVAP